MLKKKIETPGSGNDTSASCVVAEQVETLSKYAEQINRSDDASAKQEIAEILAQAKRSLLSIREHEQIKAAKYKRKTDMSNVKIHKATNKAITGKGIKLTKKGYIVD